MRLRDRYRRLTLWNKLAVWGSIASFTGIGIALLQVSMSKTELHSADPGSRQAEDVRFLEQVKERISDSSSREQIELISLFEDSAPRFGFRRWSAGSSSIATPGGAPLQYCIEAPPGRRIAAYKVVVLHTVNTAPNPESFFRITESSERRVCYEVVVQETESSCPTCEIATPLVRWKVLAKLSAQAATSKLR